jgi:signal transduction histidine kinase
MGPEQDSIAMRQRERLVVIVDDSPEDREAVRRYLKKDTEIKYRFLEHASGAEGLRTCRAPGIDCLLLDYDLPDINGLQFLAELTEGTDEPPVPVVMLTGRGGESVAVQALKRGAQDYLVKGSYSPEILWKTVDDAIERVEIRRQLDRQRKELERLYTEARESDRRKDEFLAMLAHELRNPLAPILNAVHIMKLRADERETVDRMREIIEQQMRHITRLVDDLLDVSRITRGKIQLRSQSVDLASIVGQALDSTRPAIERRGQRLTLEFPDESLQIDADSTRIEQVIVNLLSNASKYTDPSGSIALTVKRSGGNAVISVKDSGIGITPELLPHVFDLFTQADHSLDRSEGGLGIGLTLVRSLVQMHGGEVEARSDGLGQGSEFIVRLPLARPFLESGLAPEAEPIATSGDSLRILIVDDNSHAAESLGIIVKLWHHDVRVAFDGIDALALAESYRPQVILLDIGLPGMDGYSVARSIRSRPELEGVRLVAMTGYGRDEDFQKSKSAGFDHHLVKPIDFTELQTLLGSIGSERSNQR